MDQVRVIGSPQGFAIYGPKQEKLAAAAVDVFCRPNQPPHVAVALAAGNVDIVGKPIFAVVDPKSGRPRVVKRIEWADGGATDFPEPEKAGAIVTPESNGASAA